MKNEQKKEILNALVICGTSFASKAFVPTEEQIKRINELVDTLDSTVLSAITEDFEDVLNIVEDYVNKEQS